MDDKQKAQQEQAYLSWVKADEAKMFAEIEADAAREEQEQAQMLTQIEAEVARIEEMTTAPPEEKLGHIATLIEEMLDDPSLRITDDIAAALMQISDIATTPPKLPYLSENMSLSDLDDAAAEFFKTIGQPHVCMMEYNAANAQAMPEHVQKWVHNFMLCYGEAEGTDD